MYVHWNKIIKSLGSFILDIDLKIAKGSLVSFLGPSGCGKTTALRIASGLISPDSGSFSVDGLDVTNKKPENRNIGLVFQNYALFPHLNVEDNICYGLKEKKIKRNLISEETEFILEKLHLKGYNKRKIESLSGGEKQRVALGRSLAVKPNLLLLDEPLSALDAELRKKLRREIKEIQKEFNITTIYVTHDQDEALSISDKIALFSGGKLIQYSTPMDLYYRPASTLGANFLGESNIVTINNELYFFRPENLIQGEDNNEINFSGIIIEKEFLGIYTRGLLKTSNNQIIKIISFIHELGNKYYIPKNKLIKIKDLQGRSK